MPISVYKGNSSEIISEEMLNDKEVKPSLYQLSVNPAHASGNWVKKQQSISNVIPMKARRNELILQECKYHEVWKNDGRRTPEV